MQPRWGELRWRPSTSGSEGRSERPHRREGARLRSDAVETAQQVAERADITRDTLRKIESGNPNVSFNNVAQVLRALGVLDQVVDTVDPLGSDIGGLRADKLVRKRAR
ncbi:helix-turn-helix domain-containing protein [Nonomuraea glycinis]|uniref:helix-turn-helix domain-containing protein n=1 Tax=Nonomuraea glycinis TaxID=2047744 RepID=UPI002E14B231|nr:helix-turn-helix domain-containing protein [Nonomuraea glycinis]